MIKKIVKYCIVFLVLIGIILSLFYYSNTIKGRDFRFGDANVNHYKVFPYKNIFTSDTFQEDPDLLRDVEGIMVEIKSIVDIRTYL